MRDDGIGIGEHGAFAGVIVLIGQAARGGAIGVFVAHRCLLEVHVLQAVPRDPFDLLTGRFEFFVSGMLQPGVESRED